MTGLSRTTFALMIGVSRQYLADIEKGEANATVGMLERIAGGLGMAVEDLFYDL
ncbi:anaerobic benzoate catabolism transcriptional regulator [Coriobacteriaceae bacterium CHKCI002]|nr:anaerobic benzoate catabolism transcriptional regulator [Coriobacteriaceae bacterium CHKCI002]